MQSKLLEVHDEATTLIVMATRPEYGDPAEAWCWGREGFADGTRYTMITYVTKGITHYDPYNWGSRTLFEAHQHIAKHFDTLKTGDVVDVEYIIGKRMSPKLSERFTS